MSTPGYIMNAGLPIEVLVEYVTLFEQGDQTIQARKNLLIEQIRILMDKVEEMKKTIERLDYKIERYEKTVMAKEKELIKLEDSIY